MFVRGLPMQTADAVLQSTPSSQSHAAEYNRYTMAYATKEEPLWNEEYSFQLFVVVSNTCSVWYQLVSPSVAHAVPY